MIASPINMAEAQHNYRLERELDLPLGETSNVLSRSRHILHMLARKLKLVYAKYTNFTDYSQFVFYGNWREIRGLCHKPIICNRLGLLRVDFVQILQSFKSLKS